MSDILKTQNTGGDEGFLIIGESDLTQSKSDLADHKFQELDAKNDSHIIDSQASASNPEVDYLNLLNLYEHATEMNMELMAEIEALKAKSQSSDSLEVSQLRMETKKLSLLISQLNQKCVQQEKHINELGLVSQLDAQKVKDTLIELEVTKAKSHNEKTKVIEDLSIEIGVLKVRAEHEKREAVEATRVEFKAKMVEILNESEAKFKQYESEIRSQAIRGYKPDIEFEKIRKELQETQAHNLQLLADLKKATVSKPLPQQPLLSASPSVNLIVKELSDALMKFLVLTGQSNREFLSTTLQPIIEVYFSKMEAMKRELKSTQDNLRELTTNAEYLQLQIDDYKQRTESLKNDNETLNEIIAMLKSDAN